MIAILLDSETRKEADHTQLEQESKGVLRFLDRAMLENYILFPDAILAVLNDLGETLTLEQAQEALANAGISVSGDVSKVHGANTLANVFSALTKIRYQFNKTRDVPENISWLIASKPESLRPLGSFLRSVAELQDGRMSRA